MYRNATAQTIVHHHRPSSSSAQKQQQRMCLKKEKTSVQHKRQSLKQFEWISAIGRHVPAEYISTSVYGDNDFTRAKDQFFLHFYIEAEAKNIFFFSFCSYLSFLSSIWWTDEIHWHKMKRNYTDVDICDLSDRVYRLNHFIHHRKVNAYVTEFVTTIRMQRGTTKRRA